MRVVVLALLLAGCAARAPTVDCPAPIPIPKAAPPHPTAKQVDALEIRVELAREAERRRAEACAGAVAELRAWIERHMQ